MATPMIDESLYSRQLYVLGHEAMNRMSSAHVLLVGLSGAGVELAKNLALAGVGALTLHDPTPARFDDLASNFFLNESDVTAGRPRAAVVLPFISELNPYVRVSAWQSNSSDVHLVDAPNIVQALSSVGSHVSVLALVDPPCGFSFHRISQINAACRELNIKFVLVESRGLTAAAFCDFGANFVCLDKDGEEPFSAVVTSVDPQENADGTWCTLVTVHEDTRIVLESGDTVRFEGLTGVEELNSMEPVPVKVTGPFSMTIPVDSRGFSQFVRGGQVIQVKQPSVMHFLPFSESAKNPETLICDFSKMEAPRHLHVAYLALAEYKNVHGGSLPAPHTLSHTQDFIEIAKRVNAELHVVESLDVVLLEKFARTAAGALNALAAFIGGFTAQEVLKAVSGKFGPLRQWIYFDAFEAFDPIVTAADAAPRGCRYDGQIAVFGAAFQEKLAKLKYFIVGAGALGCEFLKNFAMMGIGSVIVTDMDTIEMSNLSRQFLFRRQHVGKSKSVVAAEAARHMNPAMHVTALQDKVAPDTEHVFTDLFWTGLDGVCNALDNVQARLYVDSRCVYYGKSLLESGTLGTKANAQVVVPRLTESYGSSRDPPEKSIPICTLKNFPYAIEHTIQWARDLFEGLWVSRSRDANSFLDAASRDAFLDTLRQNPSVRKPTLESVLQVIRERPKTIADCVAWARNEFERLFANDMKQLLFNFPIDQITSTGAPFWSGLKRPPTPVSFSTADPLHVDFIVSATNLCAQMCGIADRVTDDQRVRDLASSVPVTQWAPKTNVRIAASDAELQSQPQSNEAASATVPGGSDEEAEIAQIERQLLAETATASHSPFEVIEFEKDDDSNFHVAFVTAASNLRARSYAITEADRHRTKMIAGKIIPAMVTTTALITGIVMIELIKIAQGRKDIESYRNAFVNLALPFCTMSEPIKAATQKWKDLEFSLWSHIEVQRGDLTLRNLIDYFEQELHLVVSMIASGQAILYSSFGNQAKNQERMNMPMSVVYETVSKKKIADGQVYLVVEAMVADKDTDEDVDIPPVRLRIR
eukprot:ANDGO_06581.mRNA.1 Ubiquitin-activating enzyme E1 1